MLPSCCRLRTILDQVVECIDRFVARWHWEEGPEPPLSRVPGVAVECSPWDAGGLNRVDVVAQVQALQAKVAALLLHPRRHPWKVLMQAAFNRQVPGLGYAVLLSRLEPRCGLGWIGMWGTGGCFTISGCIACCRRQSGWYGTCCMSRRPATASWLQRTGPKACLHLAAA
jgi:hypothetical protein